MKTTMRLFLMAACGLLFTSCIQHSTVLRVRKDGSGEIFVRNYFSPAIAAMAGGLGAGLEGEGAEGAGEGEITIEGMNPAEIDPDQLKADAANYGEGVRYARHEEDKNKEGWEGHLVVYEFDDINKVTLDSNSAMGGGMKEMVEAQGQEIGEDEGSKMTFEMADGVLKIKTGMGEDAINQFKENGGPGEGDVPEGMKPSQMMAMMGGMFQGMRMGYFIRVDGGIAETNATHVNGDFLTLLDVDVPAMLTDPEFMTFLDTASEKPDDVTEKMVTDLVPQIEAMKAEMAEEVTVTFK